MTIPSISLRAGLFTLTLSAGFVFAALLTRPATVHQCPRFVITDSSRRFFTLEEGIKLQGQAIKFAKVSPFNNNSGRIAGLDLIEADKFFIIVDWEATPETGEPGLRWYDKDSYEEHLTALR